MKYGIKTVSLQLCCVAKVSNYAYTPLLRIFLIGKYSHEPNLVIFKKQKQKLPATEVYAKPLYTIPKK